MTTSRPRRPGPPSPRASRQRSRRTTPSARSANPRTDPLAVSAHPQPYDPRWYDQFQVWIEDDAIAAERSRRLGAVNRLLADGLDELHLRAEQRDLSDADLLSKQLTSLMAERDL